MTEVSPTHRPRPTDSCTVPHTQIHSLLRRWLENLQDVTVVALLGLLLILSFQALWRLARTAFLDGAAATKLLAEIVFVLILIEVYRLLIFYLREHRVSVALMVEVALVSILREVMLLGAHDMEWTRLCGLSILLAVLGTLLAAERSSRHRRNEASETDAR